MLDSYLLQIKKQLIQPFKYKFILKIMICTIHIYHLNVTYLLETDPAFDLQSKPDENKAVSWIRIADLSKRVSEQWMNERIYSKLVKKITAAD